VEPNWYSKQEYVRNHPVFHLNEASIDFFYTYFHLLELQLKANLTEYREQIMKMMAKGATMEMLNYLDKLAVVPTNANERSSVNQSDYAFQQFMHLLQKYPHEREVQWYAKQMDITPKYLSIVVGQASGRRPLDWIRDLVILDAKAMLLSGDYTVSQISQHLHFANPSFFGKYFKEAVGCSPGQYAAG
jgi:AraC-like DNA-binding protein